MGKAELSQQRSHITLVIIHAKPFLDDALQIDASPANDPIGAEIRPRINNRRQFGLLIGGQTRLDAPSMQVAQSVGPELVEPVNPVPQGLPIHAADARCVSAVHAIQNRRQ